MTEHKRTNGASKEYLRGVEVGERLLGTAGTLQEILGDEEEHLAHNQDFCEGLGQTAVECTGCSWWVEPCELNEDDECEDCADDD